MSRDAELLVEEIQRVQGEARDYLKKGDTDSARYADEPLKKTSGLAANGPRRQEDVPYPSFLILIISAIKVANIILAKKGHTQVSS